MEDGGCAEEELAAMKTIIRRDSHGTYRYRTTDEDGWQDLWRQRPVYNRIWGMWVGGPAITSDGRVRYAEVDPPSRPSQTLVRIGKVAK